MTSLLLGPLVLTLVAALPDGDGAADAAPVRAFDADQALETVRVLSADDMQGRQTDSEGSAKARAWIVARLEALELAPAGASYEQPFSFASRRRPDDPYDGVNLLARIDGATPGEGPVLVVTAHYDHVGVRRGEVYNGADDNASGVAGLFAIAEAFTAEPPRHDVILAFLDAEEMGLRGARAFVEDPPVPAERLALNLNMDMISKNDEGELWATGAYHFPALRPLLDALASEVPVTLRQGHDDPDGEGQDWTYNSDHGVFLRSGVPFVYLGVEDHDEYHRPTDDFETLPQAFFLDAVETAVRVARRLDEQLEPLAAAWAERQAEAAAAAAEAEEANAAEAAEAAEPAGAGGDR